MDQPPNRLANCKNTVLISISEIIYLSVKTLESNFQVVEGRLIESLSAPYLIKFAITSKRYISNGEWIQILQRTNSLSIISFITSMFKIPNPFSINLIRIILFFLPPAYDIAFIFQSIVTTNIIFVWILHVKPYRIHSI